MTALAADRPRSTNPASAGARVRRPRGVFSVVDRVARILVALALFASVAWLVINGGLVRQIEAHLVAFWLNPLLEGGVVANRDIYTIWLNEHHLVGLQVTPECTVVVLLAPLLALGGALMFSKRVGWIRGLAGIASMIAIVLIVNQLRLGLIGWSTLEWGIDFGFEVSHRIVGSILGIVGFAGAIIVMFLITGFRRRKPHAPRN